jgi:ribosomal protein S18 acetylase RimI-like enzyme
MDIRIRRANAKDAEAISRIGVISFKTAFQNVFNCYDLKEYLVKVYDPGVIKRSFERQNNVFFLAEINGWPVGFAHVKRFSLNDEIESGSQMQLEKIYVLPEYQREGAGGALLKQVMDFANDAGPDYLWLDVYAGNEQAVHFYRKNGFIKGSTYHRGFGQQYFEFFMMMLPVRADQFLCC